MIIKLFVFVLYCLTIKYNVDALECWRCQESKAPTCGADFSIDPNVPQDINGITKETCKDGQSCVTFKNKYDGGKYMRGCTENFWVPPTGVYDKDVTGVDCIKDKYSQELFCFCLTDLCNANNTGSTAIFLVNECLTKTCANGGTCRDLYGRAECNCTGNYDPVTNCTTCKPGFSGITCQTALDKSKICDPSPCLNSGVCTANETTFTAMCNCTGTGYNGAKCETDLNECISTPCQNGATCVNTPGAYTCQCKSGFTGKLCDEQIDECSDPKLNKCNPTNGKCVDTIGSYICNCSAGFTGIYCDLDLNECASMPCKNGTCVDKVNAYECVCNPGFTGTNCETLIDICVEKTPCSPAGTFNCTSLINSFKCYCKPGYTGSDCAIEIDICKSAQPCVNGGTCTKGATYPAYTCACLAGYTGVNCSAEIDECAPNPCKYGVCTDLLANYKCQCTPGYTGKDCDADINECEPDPCYVDGRESCTNLVNGFKCVCKLGYTGVTCQTNINECSSNPCKNGGTCKDDINQYICLCDEKNYNGKRCEVPVYHCDVEPNACNGNGDCEDGVGSQPIRCVCFPGWTGQYCESKVSICQTQMPCKNNGNCSDSSVAPNGYQCFCPPSYTGTNCETKISACATVKPNCNYGTCKDLANGDFVCDCQAGYTGKFCTEKVFSCTEQGTFADPVHCERYINCIDQGNGVFAMEENICQKLSTYQLLFDPTKKVCVLPGKHPNPTCYTPL